MHSYCSMNGVENGVQLFMKKFFQLAIYNIHCIIYCFDLAVSLACKVICTRNALRTINSCYNFFRVSKCQRVLKNEMD